MDKHLTAFVGIDLGDKQSVVHVRNQAGEFVEETCLTTTKSALERAFCERTPLRIALEVGTHSRWVSRQLASYGHDVVVADPRQLRLIYKNPRKSDRVDVEYLARLVRMDPELLSPVSHRNQGGQQHLALLRSRDSLVSARTQLVNHARGMVKSFVERLPPCSTESFAQKARPALPEGLRLALEPILDCIREISQRIKSYDQEIQRLCIETYPETAKLRQIKGVGAPTALAFVLTLDNAGRFKTSREVGACLGLVPKRSQSGEVHPQGGITTTGDPYLRQLLVGSAHYLLGPFGEESRLRLGG